MPIAVRRALSEANLNVVDVDGIAFTRGPGIGGCLAVCLNAAKTLAAALDKPIVGVHHMQAHALTPLLTTPLSSSSHPHFPFLTLLVSGGHTLLLLAHSPTSFKTLATTPDISIGNAFDKVARLLRLPWSSLGPGAALEKFAQTSNTNPEDLPIVPPFPLSMRSQLAFSFSGLYSAVERYHASCAGYPDDIDESTKVALARAFQVAAVGQLEEKLGLGLGWCSRKGIAIRHVVVSGGVASNQFLRDRLKACLIEASPDEPISLVFPPPSLCTDNAVMIAWASMDRFLARNYDDYSIAPRSKWDIEELASSTS